MAQSLNKRDPALDAMRAIAIVMVVAIHTASPALSAQVGTGSWWTALFWGSLVRPAVPLFFMCSGALLLTRDIPLKRLYGHNFLRILVILLFWALVAQGYRLLSVGITPAGIWEALTNVLLFRHEPHFYFLQLLLLVYVFLPVTRVFVRNASEKELRYFLIVWAVTGILIPLLQYFPPFSGVAPLRNWYRMNIAYSSIGYGVLGHYLRQHGRSIPRKGYLLSLLAGFAVIFCGTALTSLHEGRLVEIFLEGWSPGSLLFAFGLFGLVLSVKAWKPALVRFTGRLSAASLCIYLIHGVFLEVLEKLGLAATAFLPLVSIPVIVILVIALNWLVYEVLSRIPIVRTWLV